MKIVFGLLGIVLFVVCSGGIFLFGLNEVDPPPEAVVESFTRNLTSHQYDRAWGYLDEDFKRSLGGMDALKRLALDLEQRVGETRDVRGEPLSISEHDAQAQAILKTSRTRFHCARFILSRENGHWLIGSIRF